MTVSKRQLIASANLGELAANYRLVRAEKEVKETFDKMSLHCEHREFGLLHKKCRGMEAAGCLYYHDNKSHKCEEDICPILKKE